MANELKNSRLSEIPEKTYYKILERLTKQEDIVHLTKGLYYRAEKSEKGIIPISEEHIIEHYVADKSGIVVGAHLLRQAGIISKVTEDIEILSNNLREEKNISVKLKFKKQIWY